MTIDTKSRHITPAGGNVFLDLGFEQEEAAALKAEVVRIVAERKAIKEQLMSELSGWIRTESLKQVDAALRLGVTRPRVSDLVQKKESKFTIDALIDMLTRIGKQVDVVVRVA